MNPHVRDALRDLEHETSVLIEELRSDIEQLREELEELKRAKANEPQGE